MSDKFKRGRSGTDRYFKKHGRFNDHVGGRKRSARLAPYERRDRRSRYDPDERY